VIDGDGSRPVAAVEQPVAAAAPAAPAQEAPPRAPAAPTPTPLQQARPQAAPPSEADEGRVVTPLARAAEQQATEEQELRTRSSPLVRKIAAEHGIDISQIEGTGLAGRVTKNDILSFIENQGSAPKRAAGPALSAGAAAQPAAPPPQKAVVPSQVEPAPVRPEAAAPSAKPADQPPQAARYTAEVGPPPFVEGDRYEIEPMSMMRRRIAERMVESRHISAHVTSIMEIDFTETSRLRDKLKVEYLERDGVRLTFMPFIIKAVIEGIMKWPIVNSSVWGDQIVYKKDINIGIAVALDWGLIVPVVRGADEKSLLGLARAVNDLGDRARTKQLKPDEVQGGTFTITNPGGFGSLVGTPIINQPQVAILGVGVIKKRPVVINDAIAIREIGYFGLSFDHRVIDGAVADQFLATVRDVVESASYNS